MAGGRRRLVRKSPGLFEMMPEMTDVIRGDERQRDRSARADRAHHVAPALRNPFDDVREMSIVGAPQRDDVIPRRVLISLHTNPVVLRVAGQREIRSLLRSHKSLMVVRGRIHQMSHHLLRRPFPRRTWTIYVGRIA